MRYKIHSRAYVHATHGDLVVPIYVYPEDNRTFEFGYALEVMLGARSMDVAVMRDGVSNSTVERWLVPA